MSPAAIPFCVNVSLLSYLTNLTWLFLMITVPRIGLQYVIVVFPDHTHLLFEANISTVINFTTFLTVITEVSFRTIQQNIALKPIERLRQNNWQISCHQIWCKVMYTYFYSVPRRCCPYDAAQHFRRIVDFLFWPVILYIGY